MQNERYYKSHELARVDIHNCTSCSKCCHNMGQSILLTPWDIHQISKNTGLTFLELLDGPVELHVDGGLVFPNIRMMVGPDSKDENDLTCPYLNKDGRCFIHDYRPGVCRLFPLGRKYEDDNQVSYFILEDACPCETKSKIKIEKHLGIDHYKAYESYMVAYKDLQRKLITRIYYHNEEAENINKLYLENLFVKEYPEEFYTEAIKRIQEFPLD